ncbi:MAG: ornithine cyclodeaminase family protein [Pirellulaceae bacterium]
MLILNAAQVVEALPMPDAITAMLRALTLISDPMTAIPPRIHVELAEKYGTTLVMPGQIHDQQGKSLVVKIVSVCNGNIERGLPNILGVVNVFDPETGQPLALLDGSALTGIRTAAASGVATDLLARQDARRLAIIGSGAQARSHLTAMRAVRDIEQVKVYSRNRDHVLNFISSLDVDIEVQPADSADEAVGDANIVCAVTSSSTPVFDDAAIQPGTHINAIGSYKPEVVEIPAATVVRARVFVDHRESVLEEAGDLIQPIQRGEITATHIAGEIGELIAGKVAGRQSADEVTLFKSVGNTLEDVIGAQTVYDNANRMGLGNSVAM